jgi:hypothetical protein
MNSRTAILISCLSEEAGEIRARAKRARQTLCGYVLFIVMRAVAFEAKLSSSVSSTQFQQWNRALCRLPNLPHGPRTTVLLYCSREESKLIRLAAARRGMTISGFIRHCLRRSWNV